MEPTPGGSPVCRRKGETLIPPAGTHRGRLARLRPVPGDSLCTATCRRGGASNRKAGHVPPLLWRLHSSSHSPFPHVTPAAPTTPGSSSCHHAPARRAVLAQTPCCPREGSSPGRRAEGCYCKAGPQELALGDGAHQEGGLSPGPWGAVMTHMRPPPGPSTCPLLCEYTEGPRGSSPRRGWRGPPSRAELLQKGSGTQQLRDVGKVPSE